MKKKKEETACPAAKMLALLSERHMLALIYNLSSGPKGFSDLQSEMAVNSATLSKRLRTLEDEAIVEKRACTSDSRRHYYVLTKRGKKLSAYIQLFSKV